MVSCATGSRLDGGCYRYGDRGEGRPVQGRPPYGGEQVPARVPRHPLLKEVYRTFNGGNLGTSADIKGGGGLIAPRFSHTRPTQPSGGAVRGRTSPSIGSIPHCSKIVNSVLGLDKGSGLWYDVLTLEGGRAVARWSTHPRQFPFPLPAQMEEAEQGA